jgi:hypothetical protein
MVAPVERLLVLVRHESRFTGTVDDHLNAFKQFGRRQTVVMDAYCASRFGVNLDQFDAVILHYTIEISNPDHLPIRLAAALSKWRGLKALFIQDEMRWVNRTAEAIRDLGISLVYSVISPDVRPQVYRHPWLRGLRFEFTLTGFVPEKLTGIQTLAFEERPLDVVYRGRVLPAWCGEFGQLKRRIGERFSHDAAVFDLRCDISNAEKDRIYGDKWIKFLATSKAALCVEGGASFVDFSDEIRPQIDAYEALHPVATFEEIKDKFLGEKDGEITIKAISPRCFEAASLRTLMVMYPGAYSGVFEAGRHFVALDFDHSNMREVVEVLRSPKRAKEIIACAYEEIACAEAWTYRTFIAQFDRVLDEELLRLDDCTKIPLYVRNQDNEIPWRDMVKLESKCERTAQRRTVFRRSLVAIAKMYQLTSRNVEARLPAALASPVLGMMNYFKRFIRRRFE